jgi:hypothetical protein
LYTIEFSELYHYRTKSKYDGNKIQFILGDSSIVLADLLPTLLDKSIFFLDGHWSSGDTGRSEKDCPLIEEITHIHNLFRNEAIIIIDDYRLFGSGVKENWSEISKTKILNIIGNRVTKVYHLDSELHTMDRFIIHIRAM